MRKEKLIIVRLLIVAIIFTCISGTVYAETGTSFSLVQGTETVTDGQKIEIVLNGNNLKSLYAYEAVISFDPAIADYDTAESKLEGFFMPPKVDNGKITTAFTKIGKKAGEQGTIPLCTIAFKTKAQGNANIKLISVKALDPDLTAVSYNYEVNAVKTFADLAGYEWAKMEIEALATSGIIKGTSDTTFSPGSNTTRADFICLLVRALKFSADIDANFIDVAQSDYFYNEVGIAKKLGIALGTGDNLFKPRESISRQDMMVLVSRAMKIAGKQLDESASDLSKFTDSAEVAPYAVGPVAQLVKEGIIQGSNGRINPKGTAIRAEAAVIIYRILNK